MTQEEYQLWSGRADNHSAEDFEKLLIVAMGRVADYLCRPDLPDPLPNDLKVIVANFMAAEAQAKGGGKPLKSHKTVRNFSIIEVNERRGAFVYLEENFGDIIEKYSNCPAGVAVERGTDYECF